MLQGDANFLLSLAANNLENLCCDVAKEIPKGCLLRIGT